MLKESYKKSIPFYSEKNSRLYTFFLSRQHFYRALTQRGTLFVSYILSGYVYPISPINHWEMLRNAMRHSFLYVCWQNWKKKIKNIYVKRLVLIEYISRTFYPSYWRHLYSHQYFWYSSFIWIFHPKKLEKGW